MGGTLELRRKVLEVIEGIMSEDRLSTLVSIKCKQQTIRAVRFNIDGTYCLTCGADKKIKLWNPHRELLLKTYVEWCDSMRVVVPPISKTNHVAMRTKVTINKPCDLG
ncbi:unnamed protein product, partial [Iphiclides podalirius]